jgi:hypothetical protein
MIISAAVMGCDRETEITNVINDYVSAYNIRNSTACVDLYFMTNEQKEEEKDHKNLFNLQYYFDVHPSTPTYIVRIGDMWKYLDSYDYVFVETKSSEEAEWESGFFMLIQTKRGFFGYFGEWLIIYNSIPDSPYAFIN